MLSFIPDEWLHLAVLGVLALGAVLYLGTFVLGFLPPLKAYTEPLRILSTLILVAGVFFYGSYDTEMHWRAKVAEEEEINKIMDAKSKAANEVIKTKIITKIQIVKVHGDDVIKYVDREIVKYDTKFAPGGVCEIPKEFIKAHNDAAEAPK